VRSIGLSMIPFMPALEYEAYVMNKGIFSSVRRLPEDALSIGWTEMA
jgi:hypothetical protein